MKYHQANLGHVQQQLTKLKIPPEYQGDIYMDGLVSTGNKFPNTILEIIFINQKIFPNYFINILILPVDKRSSFKQPLDDLYQRSASVQQ